MGSRDGYFPKGPNAIHLPEKLVDPRVRTKAIAAEAIRGVKDGRKQVSAPTLLNSVFTNVATHYIGSWGVLKRDHTRVVGLSDGTYEGLNEILAELDPRRYLRRSARPAVDRGLPLCGADAREGEAL